GPGAEVPLPRRGIDDDVVVDLADEHGVPQARDAVREIELQAPALDGAAGAVADGHGGLVAARPLVGDGLSDGHAGGTCARRHHETDGSCGNCEDDDRAIPGLHWRRNESPPRVVPGPAPGRTPL